MENQESSSMSNIPPINSASAIQPSIPIQSRQIFLPIMIVVLVSAIIFGLGGYLLGKQSSKSQQLISNQRHSPTITPLNNPIPTSVVSGPLADWKTYQSKRFSIQFSYPPKYVLENEYENTYSDQGFIHLYTQQGYELVKSKAPRDGPDFMQVGAYSNPKNLTPLEWAQSDTDHSNFTGKYETANIAGENGLAYTFEGMGLGDTRVIAHNGYIYTFAVMGDVVMQTDFKRILDTVKFIK